MGIGHSCAGEPGGVSERSDVWSGGELTSLAAVDAHVSLKGARTFLKTARVSPGVTMFVREETYESLSASLGPTTHDSQHSTDSRL